MCFKVSAHSPEPESRNHASDAKAPELCVKHIHIFFHIAEAHSFYGNELGDLVSRWKYACLAQGYF